MATHSEGLGTGTCVACARERSPAQQEYRCLVRNETLLLFKPTEDDGGRQPGIRMDEPEVHWKTSFEESDLNELPFI